MRCLAAIGLGTIVVQAVAFGPARAWLWGFHLPAFLPFPFTIATWVLVLAAIAWALRGRAVEGRLERLAARAVPRPVPAALAVASGALFWGLRSQQTILGDAWPLVSDLPRGLEFHPRQPLAMAFQQAMFRAAGGLFGAPVADAVQVAKQTVALANVLVGVLFVATAWRLGIAVERIARPEAARAASATAVLASLVVLGQGFCLLFYGYLETYALFALLVGLFLLAGIEHARGRWPLFAPALAWLAAVGVHMAAIILAPPLLLLAMRGLVRPAARAGTLRDLAIAAAAALALDRLLASMSPGFSLGAGLAGILRTASTDQGSGAGLGYLLSGRHLRDFVNAQALLGPLGAFLFVPAALFAARRGALRDPVLGFLVVAAASGLGASAATSDPALGYARDWDLFAPVAVAYVVAGLALVARLVPDVAARARLLVLAIAISIPHLGAWVLVNHSEPRSMARFATLPLGQGRVEVALGNWHYRNGRRAEAVAWFERALDADPRNSSAWAFLGQIHVQDGAMARAADAFGRATSLRPDKPLFRHNYVKALEALGRHAESLPHHEVLCRIEPDRVENWLGWATALRQLGREEAERAVLSQSLARFEGLRTRAPEDFRANLDLGILLAGLGRPADALVAFQQALRAEPRSDAALYNAGSMLMRLGRTEEARPYLERLLQHHPGHPTGAEVRAWLAGAGAR